MKQPTGSCFASLQKVLCSFQQAHSGVGCVVWCGEVWCDVMWCGVVWCGVVWCGVVWFGVVWCGVVWCDVVCSTRLPLTPWLSAVCVYEHSCVVMCAVQS